MWGNHMVRILDPKTKLPVKDLGDNNTVMIEIKKQDAITLAEKAMALQQQKKSSNISITKSK